MLAYGCVIANSMIILHNCTYLSLKACVITGPYSPRASSDNDQDSQLAYQIVDIQRGFVVLNKVVHISRIKARYDFNYTKALCYSYRGRTTEGCQDGLAR